MTEAPSLTNAMAYSSNIHGFSRASEFDVGDIKDAKEASQALLLSSLLFLG